MFVFESDYAEGEDLIAALYHIDESLSSFRVDLLSVEHGRDVSGALFALLVQHLNFTRQNLAENQSISILRAVAGIL